VVEDDNELITLQDEHGLEHRFTLVDVVDVGGRRYAVLQPEEGEDDDPAAVVFRIEGEERLVPIDDDEELGRVMTELEERYGDVVLDEDDEEGDELDLLDETEEFDTNGELDEEAEDG
jgi:uncharacterized protein YrzB (UPF0473 family)